MSRKWHNFKNTHTANLNVTSPSLGRAQLREDLARTAFSVQERKTVQINGVPLNKIARAYNHFKEDKDIEQFFSQVLLRDFNGTQAQKAQAIDYLKNTFHQGGLLFPVSSALTTELKDKNGNLVCTTVGGFEESNVNIQTTSEGFKIQELTRIGAVLLAVPIGKNQPGTMMLQEQGADSLLKAEATIAVNFKNGDKPSLTVESNQMDSHPGLKEHLDHRGLGQKIVDFFKNLFFDSVIEIAPQKADEQLEAQLMDIMAKPIEQPQEQLEVSGVTATI